MSKGQKHGDALVVVSTVDGPILIDPLGSEGIDGSRLTDAGVHQVMQCLEKIRETMTHSVQRSFPSIVMDAEDVVAEAFERAYLGLPKFKGEGCSLKHWMYRIATNVAIGLCRSGWRRSLTRSFSDVLSPDESGITRSLEDVLPDPSVDIIGTQAERDLVGRVLASVPNPFHECLYLYVVEGMLYREIADTLGVPIGTVKSRINRGMKTVESFLRREILDL